MNEIMKYAPLVLTILSGIIWILRYLSFNVKSSYFFYFGNVKNKFESFIYILILCLGLFSFAIIIYGMNGPKVLLGKSLSHENVSDTYVVLDISRSMLANDFVPNRLAVAKKIIQNFFEKKKISRAAVILFAEKVLTYVPLTDNFNYL